MCADDEVQAAHALGQLQVGQVALGEGGGGEGVP